MKKTGISPYKSDFCYYFIKTIFPYCPVYADVGMFFHSKCFAVHPQGEVCLWWLSSCTALQCGLIKQSQEDCSFFPFETGKHKVASYQVKQDKLKKPSGGRVTGNNIQKQYFVEVRHTLGFIATLRVSSSATTALCLLRPYVNTEVYENSQN